MRTQAGRLCDGLEKDANGVAFFKEDLVGPLGEEFRKRSEGLVDEDQISLVVVHELVHGAVGVVVVDEEAGDNKVDDRKVELFVSADQAGDVLNLVFGKLLRAQSKGRRGEVVNPEVVCVAPEDKGFRAHTGSENENAFVFKERDALRQPVGQSFGDFPADVVVNFNTGTHFIHDFLFHPRMCELHQREGFGSDLSGLEKVGHGRWGSESGELSATFQVQLPAFQSGC